MEPIFHSFITDELPEDHKLAWEHVHCATCKALVHAVPNECMREWFETGVGALCLNCFVVRVELGDYEGLGFKT